MPLIACAALFGCGSAGQHAGSCPPGEARAAPLATCTFDQGRVRARITVDDQPQAWVRWERADEERRQTAMEWSHTPSQRPVEIAGVGAGAFWVPATRELVASDGRRLLTVRVLRPAAPTPARNAAKRLARRGLGPPHVPERTGP